MKKQRLDVIVCPHCGREYLPSEIYLPDSFLGKAKNVMRMTDGSIEAHFGRDMDLVEEYICDKCNAGFTVQAKVTFKTFPKHDVGFKEEYVTRINKLRMQED